MLNVENSSIITGNPHFLKPRNIFNKRSLSVLRILDRKMRDYSRKDYYNAVSELVNVITQKYGNRIRSIYAGGSFARDDFVPGRSDIDIYIVVENRKSEIWKDLQREALEIEKKYFNELKSVFGEVLGVSVTTLEEIQEGKSFLGAGFEYSNFVREGKLLWGEDVRKFIPKPSPERQKESARKYLDQVYGLVSNQERIFKWLKWVPFKLVPKKRKLRWTREAFSLIFRTAALFLGSRGINVSRKEDITSAFRQQIQKNELCDIIFSTLLLWEKWKSSPLTDKETKKLVENSLKFVKGLQSLH